MEIDRIIEACRGEALHRLWILSDLQQREPARATRHMRCAMEDFLSLGMPVEAVCYLGDATEGTDLAHIREMASMQQQEFSRVDAPVYYVLGNHDFDYFRHLPADTGEMRIPFLEYMRAYPQWHLPEDISRAHYMVDMGDFALCFLTDHADPQGRWFTSHGTVVGRETGAYPHSREDYQKLAEEMAALGKPVITLSHYAFPGGNREAGLFSQCMPLPDNVRIHFYGHAHIGDARCAGPDCFRKVACVNDHPIMQMDVASLENGRGNAVRSVLLEWYPTREIGVFFRNHSLHCWDDAFFLREGDMIGVPRQQA